jgi:hypothetical protein
MTTATATSTGAPPRGADLAGRALLTLCALSTTVAFADGVTRVTAAPAEWVLTERPSKHQQQRKRSKK